MKRRGNLFQIVASLENIKKAEIKAQKGKQNYPEIKKWNKNKEENIQEVYSSLQNKSYKPSGYTTFTIYEPKSRQISKSSFKDRVVHHCIMNVLEPIFEKCFIAQSYSCRKNKGIHKCLSDLNLALKQKSKTLYCLKLDIRHFYQSVDNTILKRKLRQKFKDINLLSLVDSVIDNHNGLPLGSFTSQWFANFYLNDFDHWLKQSKSIKHYFRYCDDLVILHSDKEFLHKLRKQIENYLLVELNLKLSNYQVFPIHKRGIDFIGYKSFHTHILLRKSIKMRLKRMLSKNPNSKSKASYNGWLLHCNSVNLRRTLKI